MEVAVMNDTREDDIRIHILLGGTLETWESFDIRVDVAEGKPVVVIYDNDDELSKSMEKEKFFDAMYPHLDMIIMIAGRVVHIVGYGEEMYKMFPFILEKFYELTMCITDMTSLELFNIPDVSSRHPIIVTYLPIDLQYLEINIIQNTIVSHAVVYPDLICSKDVEPTINCGDSKLVADITLRVGVLDYIIKCYNMCSPGTIIYAIAAIQANMGVGK